MTPRQRFCFNFNLPFVPVSLPVSFAVVIALCSSSAMAQFSFPNLFGGGRPSAPASAPRGSDVERWSDGQILQAVEERDERVVQAIRARAESSVGDPAVAQLMLEILNRNSGVMSALPAQKGRPGEPGFPSDIEPPEDGETLTPPGGAQLLPGRPLIPATRSTAVTTIEAIVGEALLSYVPQASGSGSSDAASGSGSRPSSQTAAQGSGSRDTSQTAAQGSGTQGSGTQGSGTQGSGSRDSGVAGAQGSGAYESSFAAPGTPPPVGYPGSQGEFSRPNGSGNNATFAGTLADDALLRAVVRALVTNATEVSTSVLAGLADGSIVSAVSTPQLEEILLVEILEAHADAETVTEVVRTTAQKVLTESAEPAVMTSIASLGATSTETILNLAEPVEQMTKDVDQVAATRQSTGQSYGASEDEYTDSLQYGSSQFTQAGNTPPAAVTAALEFQKFTAAANAADPIAAALWNPRMVTAINEQLSQDTPSLELLALAINIPSDEVRHALFGLFGRLYEAGAGGMVQSGLFTEFARDPAILPVLKALPRQRPARRNENAGGAADANATWTEATYQTLTALRERLRRIDSNPQFAHSGKAPVPLHDRKAAPDASITIEAMASGSSGAGAVDPDPTTIHYTRLTVHPERATEMQSIVDHYEKRAAAFKRVRESEKILWYDGVKKNSDGTRTSIDVLIEEGAYKLAAKPAAPAAPAVSVNPLTGAAASAGSGSGDSAAGAGRTFTIEIITVTVRDPKEPPGAVTAAVN